jgi:phosphohistidine swiveling domain-containing protein
MTVVLKTSISQGDTEMADKEVLVVASKVKAYIKSKEMMTSSDAIVALSDKVYAMLDDAVARTKANRRSTVKAQDL